MPCHLDIALNGLSALKVLRDLSTFKFSFSSINRLNVDTCSRKVTLQLLKRHVRFFEPPKNNMLFVHLAWQCIIVNLM